MLASVTLWAIYDQRTGRRATVAGFFSRHAAEAQIARWRRRQAKGGRPDVSVEDLDAMYVDRVGR